MMENLEDYVAALFGIDTADLFTRTRRREVVDARKVCMAVMRDFTPATLSIIGSFFKMKHCNVIHGIKSVKELSLTDKVFKNRVERVYDRVRSNCLYLPFSCSDEIYSIVMEEDLIAAWQ